MTVSTPSSPTRAKPVLRASAITLHALALCLVCYLASARLVDVSGVLLARAGMAWIDAVFVASMLGFVYWLIVLLWAFSRRGVVRAWLNLGALTALSVGAAWLFTGTAP